MEKNLTTGSVPKRILLFSLPYLLSYFLQTLYGMADLFIIGQYEGVASTTAVSVGSQVMHMLTVVLVGLAMGSTVAIGQAVGGGKRQKTAACVGNTVTLFMSLSLVLTAVLLVLARPIVSLISTPQDAVAGAVSYLSVCFAGIPFIVAYNILSSIFRGMGDSKSPMYFIAIACVVNIALDYLFMGAMGMGPVGAALGTTLAQAVSVAVSLVMMRRRQRGLRITRQDLKPRRAIMGQILKIGVPVALQDGFIQISFLLITVIANHRGLNDAAAVGIVEKNIGFLFLGPSAMLSTVSALGAQNIGAGKPERAVQTLRYAILMVSALGLAVSVTIQFIAEPIVALFTDVSTPEGGQVVRLGGQYLRGYVWDCFLAGIQFSFSGYFCAYGRSDLSFLHNLLSVVLVRVPGAYLTSRLFADTLFPMGLASAAGSMLSVIVCLIAFRHLRRKEKEKSLG
ncbi:MAG: MATE family efflux transporter [Candidatus Limiplasma sp.]|nr:MATE family efflux transporter [Candidatus Limiplasma sp.]